MTVQNTPTFIVVDHHVWKWEHFCLLPKQFAVRETFAGYFRDIQQLPSYTVVHKFYLCLPTYLSIIASYNHFVVCDYDCQGAYSSRFLPTPSVSKYMFILEKL